VRTVFPNSLFFQIRPQMRRQEFRLAWKPAAFFGSAA
jgi:hypothetical protein